MYSVLVRITYTINNTAFKVAQHLTEKLLLHITVTLPVTAACKKLSGGMLAWLSAWGADGLRGIGAPNA